MCQMSTNNQHTGAQERSKQWAGRLEMAWGHGEIELVLAGALQALRSCSYLPMLGNNVNGKTLDKGESSM